MLDEIRQERIKKLNHLKEMGINAFPVKTSRDFSVESVIKDFGKLTRRKKPLFLAGRILAIRSHGGSIFCDFTDGSGVFQAFLKKDILGEFFSHFEETIDIGDFVEWKGVLFATKKKEKTIQVLSWKILGKSLRSLPEKWHGLQDVEERFRKRYLDILMNAEIKDKFILRSKMIGEIRSFLDVNGFIEVETPVLHPLSGGANAEPFITHQNSLDIDLYLRIAPELYLKRLLIGGMPKIYELGRLFRNEGIDTTHNPEFTELELYEAYQNAEGLRDFIESLVRKIVKKICGKEIIEYREQKINCSRKFTVIQFYETLKRHAFIINPEKISKDELLLKARQFGIDVDAKESQWKIFDHIFKKICRPKIIQPTFVINYPLESSPLAKKIEGELLLDRFQLIIGGLEIANGFSELNDPLEQKERFLAQEKLAALGDKEANSSDEDYIEAMEYGMPPAAGVGIGIDRMAMLLTDTHNIKEIIFFPTMRLK
ncbi:MAG: lysine--tRNA ligase [Candidatus Tagabacteria bacterium CG_4_10_14_0_2_um_filter_40_13]|uniref:Lysine--tRNA ligase n=2 Tax=Candidatus Tagaibacteriota TaxID=1817918 RepID=A0A2M7B9P8_9BACT|nr:MAG: lysine--tRNA ligase [Candidatus Tagabacteria bacterium CG11_big_fil_rev_8_21_14_0_20_41_11]PIU99818.1 MAG: lysine--tRNA ligase [Candidatus Tagabacteria bacterium CG03_land_8_20_14_0_80_41_22]PIZ56032.1 MAG: lysine--tRNA ligase [Candidatus Tagabacteria bacterium CG_4_10_14_0_2_um_filter_40_13]PJC25239.1 MAG: lysine--tRNA ligase [Candidatus Tagabacteria bacterium CG_4_9_14_0_2_um_filter_41_11]